MYTVYIPYKILPLNSGDESLFFLLYKAFGLRGICRGDELFEVNGQSSHSNMRQELVVSLVVCLLFRPVSKGPKGPEDMRRCPVLGTSLAHKDLKDVQNACHIDNTDPEPDVQPLGDQSGRRLSLSDPLPLSPEVDEADEDHEDALSEASFYSMKSSASSLSSSSQCSRNQPSSGRSCPSTDWEFQGYQCHNGQMLPPFARSISSGHVPSSGPFSVRYFIVNAHTSFIPIPMPYSNFNSDNSVSVIELCSGFQALHCVTYSP